MSVAVLDRDAVAVLVLSRDRDPLDPARIEEPRGAGCSSRRTLRRHVDVGRDHQVVLGGQQVLAGVRERAVGRGCGQPAAPRAGLHDDCCAATVPSPPTVDGAPRDRTRRFPSRHSKTCGRRRDDRLDHDVVGDDVAFLILVLGSDHRHVERPHAECRGRRVDERTPSSQLSTVLRLPFALAWILTWYQRFRSIFRPVMMYDHPPIPFGIAEEDVAGHVLPRQVQHALAVREEHGMLGCSSPGRATHARC